MKTITNTFSLNPWKEGAHRGCFYKALKKLLKDHGIQIPEDLRSREIKTYAKWRLIRAKDQTDISVFSLIFEDNTLNSVLELFDTLFDKEQRSTPEGDTIWEGPRLKVELMNFSGGRSITITVKPYSFCSTLRGHTISRPSLTGHTR